MNKLFGDIRSDEILDLLNEQDRVAINSVINGEAGTGGEGLSVADKTKLDNITATVPVNLDELKEKVNNNINGIYPSGEEPTDAEEGDVIIVIDFMSGQNDEDEYHFTGFKAFDGTNWVDVIDPIKNQVEENTAKLDNITINGPVDLSNLDSLGKGNFVGYYEMELAPMEEMEEGDYVGYIDGADGSITGYAKKQGGSLVEIQSSNSSGASTSNFIGYHIVEFVPVEEMQEGDYVGYIDGGTGNITGYAKMEGGSLVDVSMDGMLSIDDKNKIDNITVTGPVDLDNINEKASNITVNSNVDLDEFSGLLSNFQSQLDAAQTKINQLTGGLGATLENITTAKNIARGEGVVLDSNGKITSAPMTDIGTIADIGDQDVDAYPQNFINDSIFALKRLGSVDDRTYEFMFVKVTLNGLELAARHSISYGYYPYSSKIIGNNIYSTYSGGKSQSFNYEGMIKVRKTNITGGASVSKQPELGTGTPAIGGYENKILVGAGTIVKMFDSNLNALGHSSITTNGDVLDIHMWNATNGHILYKSGSSIKTLSFTISGNNIIPGTESNFASINVQRGDFDHDTLRITDSYGDYFSFVHYGDDGLEHIRIVKRNSNGSLSVSSDIDVDTPIALDIPNNIALAGKGGQIKRFKINGVSLTDFSTSSTDAPSIVNRLGVGIRVVSGPVYDTHLKAAHYAQDSLFGIATNHANSNTELQVLINGKRDNIFQGLSEGTSVPGYSIIGANTILIN